MKYDVKLVGQRIRDERVKNNLTREKLSEILDISDSYLGLVERGTRGITIDNLIKIAILFNVSIDSLLISNSATPSEKFTTLETIVENFTDKQIELSIKLLKDIAEYFNGDNS